MHRSCNLERTSRPCIYMASRPSEWFNPIRQPHHWAHWRVCARKHGLLPPRHACIRSSMHNEWQTTALVWLKRENWTRDESGVRTHALADYGLNVAFYRPLGHPILSRRVSSGVYIVSASVLYFNTPPGVGSLVRWLCRFRARFAIVGVLHFPFPTPPRLIILESCFPSVIYKWFIIAKMIMNYNSSIHKKDIRKKKIKEIFYAIISPVCC